MLLRTPSQRSFSPEQLDQRLRAGLVGHWINGGSGNTWLDRSGNGNHGILTNSPVWSAGIENRRSCLNFNGGTSYVNVPDAASLEGMAELTVCAWFNARSLGGGSVGRIVEKNTTASYTILMNNTTSFTGYINGTQAVSPLIPAGEHLNRWHHIVLRYDGANIIIYLDGIAGTPVAKTGAIATSSVDLVIGNRKIPDNARGFDGRIDDVRIYNRALSIAEIALLGSPSFSPVIQPARFFGKLAAAGGGEPYSRRFLTLLGVA